MCSSDLVRGLPAGGVVETAAWLVRRLAAVVPSSALDAPVDARGRSAAAGAFAAPWSRGAPIPELVAVVAARALVRGVLLLVLVGSLQVVASPSLADAVGVAGVGRIGWRLDADGLQSSRFRRMRRMALAASSTRLVELATSECGFLVSFFPGGVLLVVVGDVWRGGSVYSPRAFQQFLIRVSQSTLSFVLLVPSEFPRYNHSFISLFPVSFLV